MRKKHEFIVSFQETHYQVIRTVVDHFRSFNPIGVANGKGIFNSGILVTEDKETGITRIWFKVKRGKLNYELCRKTLYVLEQEEGLIKIERES